MPKIEDGEAVIVILHSPREKVWGVLQKIDQSGAFVRAIDLAAYDDYVTALLRHEPFIGFCDQFFPLWRVERMVRDEESAGIPSLEAQFAARTGKKIIDV